MKKSIMSFMKPIKVIAGIATLALTPNIVMAETVYRPDDWATKDLYKAEVSGILPLDWQEILHDTITLEQLSYIIEGIEKNLEEIGLVKTKEMRLIEPKTRHDVLNSLYSMLYQYEDQLALEDDLYTYVRNHNIVAAETVGEMQLQKACTVQEATLFGARVLNDIYETLDAGAKGYLWKATHEDNEVYLLGTVHVAQDGIYPFHERLDTIIETVDHVAFEVDFYDQRGYAYLLQKQMYMDGTTLKDHIEPELYTDVIEIMASFGISEEETIKYKPWAIANTITSLTANKGADTNSNEGIAIDQKNHLPIIDQYVYTLSILQDKDVLELEGYKFQADLFDTMPVDVQLRQLQDSITHAQKYEVNVKLDTEGEVLTEESGSFTEEGEIVVSEIEETEKIKETTTVTQYWVEAFIDGDIEGLELSYPKDAILESGDEMSRLLFEERDEHMATQIETYLNAEEDDRYLVVVGAGHMIGEEGIVKRLQAKGYDVQQVE